MFRSTSPLLVVFCAFVPPRCLTSYFSVLLRFCNNLKPACSFFLLLVAVESPRLNAFTAERFCSAPRLADRLATSHSATEMGHSVVDSPSHLWIAGTCKYDQSSLITEWQRQHFGQERLDVLCWRPEGHTFSELSCPAVGRPVHLKLVGCLRCQVGLGSNSQKHVRSANTSPVKCHYNTPKV